MEAKCEAENYGKCGGRLYEYPVVYHCRPRHKDLARGYGPSDSTKQVVLCEGHSNQIAGAEENKLLPELYGWDFADALDGLTCKLKFISSTYNWCEHCRYTVWDTRSKTGACSHSCVTMTEVYKNTDRQWECRCNAPLECSCASFGNNPLHWALLTYRNGYDFAQYDCDACEARSWRDNHDEYCAGLAGEEEMLALATQNPALIYQKNVKGTTPLQLIEQIQETLQETLEGPYLKYAESGWAKSNMGVLSTIQKSLMEVLDAHAN